MSSTVVQHENINPATLSGFTSKSLNVLLGIFDTKPTRSRRFAMCRGYSESVLKENFSNRSLHNGTGSSKSLYSDAVSRESESSKSFYSESTLNDTWSSNDSNKITRSRICYGRDVVFISNGRYLGYNYHLSDDLNVTNKEPLKRTTRFVLKNVVHKKDGVAVKYGDIVYLETGISHTLGTSPLKFSDKFNKNTFMYEEESSKLQLLKTYSPPEVIRSYGSWKILNKNMLDHTGGMVYSQDEVCDI